MKEAASKEMTLQQTRQMVQQLINAWINQTKLVTSFLYKYEDAAYLKELAPGRNRAIYLIGHLVATTDNMLPLIGIGEKLYPELGPIFVSAPDKVEAATPTLSTLKLYWEKVNSALLEHFHKMEPAEWLERHTAVSEADFLLEPTRNKLNILITRTIHLSNHLGQLMLLKID